MMQDIQYFACYNERDVDCVLDNMFGCVVTCYKVASKVPCITPLENYSSDSSRYITRTIIIRKCFHMLGLVMFIPATIIKPDFLAVGYAVAFAALVILELVKYQTIICVSNPLIRKMYGTVAPFGTELKRLMNYFTDERDLGDFTVTHIYLLLGCATPLWIVCAIGMEASQVIATISAYPGP